LVTSAGSALESTPFSNFETSRPVGLETQDFLITAVLNRVSISKGLVWCQKSTQPWQVESAILWPEWISKSQQILTSEINLPTKTFFIFPKANPKTIQQWDASTFEVQSVEKQCVAGMKYWVVGKCSNGAIATLEFFKGLDGTVDCQLQNMTM
jgi:hypothetical protein